jgi:hypothetical protein
MEKSKPKNVRLRDDQEKWIETMKRVNPEYNRSNLIRMGLDMLRKQVVKNGGGLPFD